MTWVLKSARGSYFGAVAGGCQEMYGQAWALRFGSRRKAEAARVEGDGWRVVRLIAKGAKA